jgi:hypothetical protein
MTRVKKTSPRKNGKVELPSAGGESPNETGGMSPTLVHDESFSSSTAVTNTDAAAATGSESASAKASDEIVGGNHQGDAQSSPVGGADGSDGSENEGGRRGDSGTANDANDEDDGDGDGVDRFNWSIEGVEGLDEEQIRHMNAFYVLLKKWFAGKEYSSGILTKADYDKRVMHLLGIKRNEIDCCEAYKSGNYYAYKWAKKYHLFTVGDSSVLVLRPDPKKSGAVDVTAMALSHLQKPTYAERLFVDLSKIHKDDHCKGTTFYKRVQETYGNVTRDVCKLFTDVCPHCVLAQTRKKSTAGIRPIITSGLGKRGQVDLVDFQSMPDGIFHYLLNYIDHGVKILFSIPLASKRATSVAMALFTIFTQIGPPELLQTDNGGEFTNAAHDYAGRALSLGDDFIDLVIKELKNLWPDCQMVRGSPRHSESNGGVERVNQTVQKKLGAWMKTNNSKRWGLGCKLVMWRYNTQHHRTVNDTPYHLVYGQHPRVGLSGLPISEDVLNRLSTEADLNHVYAELEQHTQENAQLPESSQEEVDAVAGVATAGALVALSPPTTKRKRTDNSSKDARDALRARRGALNSAVLLPMSNTANTTTTTGLTTAVSNPGGLKNDDGVFSNWLELYDGRDGIVFDLEDIKKARVRAQFPIAYCVNNKDINDEANFVPSILHKVRKQQYEVLSADGDHKIDDDLDDDWGNQDEGLSNLWSTYVKYPSQTFVDTFRERLENHIADTDALDESPRRADLRNKAAANMTKKAEAVRGKILQKSPELVIKTGDVVLVPLDDVDRTKVDPGNLIGVVVSTDKKNSTCRVAVKQGLLHRAYVYHAVKTVDPTSNNIDLHDLRDAFENYRSFPKLTERAAAKFISSVGGQGIIHCMCRGECNTNSCSCKKANRQCSSRCHRNNSRCKNKTAPEIEDDGK